MRYVVLGDGTRINCCTDSTTSNAVYAERDTYEDAGAVRDLVNKENAKTIQVYDEKTDKQITFGADLVLLDGIRIYEDGEKKICEIKTRIKTELEKLQDEIHELQDVVLE